MSARYRLAAELRALRDASGLSYGAIASQAARLTPPVKLGRSKLSSWFSGTNVPQSDDDTAFRYLIQLLEARARKAGVAPRGIDWWRARREEAAAERNSSLAPQHPAYRQPGTPGAPGTPATSATFASPASPRVVPASLYGPPLAAAGPSSPLSAIVSTPQRASVAPRGAAGSTRRRASASTSAAGGRFARGPLAVVDAGPGDLVSAYGVDGLLHDVPARSLAALVEWTLATAQFGAEKLHRWGKDADLLLVLTPAACERYGLPAELSREERLAGRLEDGHEVTEQLGRAGWRLTRRGLGPWARIYRPARGRTRRCVQLCIPSWHALDDRVWGHAAKLPPAELARVLGVYAARVMTPVGSAAVTGLELMTALNPPTKASAPDAAGKRHREHRPGTLGTEPMDPAPCEATDGHPALATLPGSHVRGPQERLFEEPYDWARELTDGEGMKRHLVGIEVNLAFAASANSATVGLATPPEHVINPAFDPAVPGSWLVDLSHVDLCHVLVGRQWRRLQGELLPSPFTPTGERPTGPAWYATPTIAYARELGYDVAPIEAWLRRDHGRFLDGWYKRLRDAYVHTLADLGVGEGLSPQEFLRAMDGYRQRDPELAIVLDVVKMTAKGGIDCLREEARGDGWRPGEAWPALARPTWRPDIRATVISRVRINMHRKMLHLAAATGQYPVAILSDCVVYAADGPSPLDVLPYDDAGRTVSGSFRIGVSPGMVVHEGTRSVQWGAEISERLGTPGKPANLARYIKTGGANGE
ncbi:telomere-associated protein Tap [Streptomyces sp. NPDC059071]|uniref:telomere-associated protein Tap n=1 Tax=unclassified Streptomyces TaxID=2593676 RepID=UPI003660F6F4